MVTVEFDSMGEAVRLALVAGGSTRAAAGRSFLSTPRDPRSDG